ncbi:MAG TPA: hypothetical protein PK852_02490 [Mesotoga prima]|uniref:hypothetical protein n=1 Tax=Mesotoga prima TaxID=1184387 RepID=UPI002B8D59DC|nr:hypothetical protein [Mesotoga prima]HPE52963.1 hypothetical protein [Mesotoga prima]
MMAAITAGHGAGRFSDVLATVGTVTVRSAPTRLTQAFAVCGTLYLNIFILL